MVLPETGKWEYIPSANRSVVYRQMVVWDDDSKGRRTEHPMTVYRRRVLDDELDALMGGIAAIAIDGAKGVGKTRTAVERAQTSYDLDAPGALAIVRAEPQRLVTGEPPILIDEWQRFPDAWDLVRRAVDDGAPAGTFLLTGSATPRDAGTHSGAGRIVRLRMRPLALGERGLDTPTVSLDELMTGVQPALRGSTNATLRDYTAEICESGFPGIRGLEPRARRAQLDGYLERIVDRDFPDAGRTVRNPAALRRWMTAYAAASATTCSYDRIRDAATAGDADKPAKTTTAVYRDVLERLWLLDDVPAWSPSRNPLARLVAAPMHQLADPALAVRLLGMDADALINAVANPQTHDDVPRNANLLGSLFESLIALNLRVYAQHAEAAVFHLRTRAGEHEVDFIVERPDHRVVAFEVKLAHEIGERDVRHLHWLREQIGDDLLDAVVITTGSEAYRRTDGIGVVPAALLGP
jgi:uncharacterized protein